MRVFSSGCLVGLLALSMGTFTSLPLKAADEELFTLFPTAKLKKN